MMESQVGGKQRSGGLLFWLIGAVLILLLGVISWYWHISHVHGPQTPAVTPVQAAERPQGVTGTSEQMTGRHIYPDASAAKDDLRKALVEAKRTHKRVIVDFGGDWCPDCQVLDIYLKQSPNAELLAQNFVKVNVNIGHMDANGDLAEKYGVPLKKGVPALAVLNANGTVLYAQKTGEFEKMRTMQASSVTEFLKQWKPRRG